MAKKTGSEETGTPRHRPLGGKVGPVGLVLLTKTASLFLVIVAYYVIVMFCAVRVVPLLMGFVLNGSGVTMDLPVETIVAVWIVPSLFLVGMLFGLALTAMKALWHVRRRLIETVSRRLLGTQDEKTVISIVEKKRTGAQAKTA